MQINHFILGAYETNCFCLRADESTKDCLIIDTGLQPEPLVDFLKQNDLQPEAVVFTHGHADHIAGVIPLRESFGEIKVVIHKNDADMLHDAEMNLSALAGANIVSDPAEVLIEADGPIKFAGLEFEVFHTPGHTPGGICLYSKTEGVLFSGDTLFASSIGRTDFPGGSFEQLIAGIKEKLIDLPEDTKVFPGHGPFTTIGDEKKYNQYLNH